MQSLKRTVYVTQSHLGVPKYHGEKEQENVMPGEQSLMSVSQ